ncbi:CBS domain-containing protein [Candidatus Bathyarchaeota archaeon]|nr:CBS domain-containing protein [Candidatus Bathyarchaeota archaeon]
MSEIGLTSKMFVKDVMSSPVVTLDEFVTSNKVAKIMAKNALGCVIVTNKIGKPVGIITERDLVQRVLAKNLVPDAVEAKSIMTSPLVTISPESTVTEAAKQMNSLNIRRLGVIYKGSLNGIVTSKDVLGVMPELIEIIQEKTLIDCSTEIDQNTDIPSASMSGYCDNCDIYSENLKLINGENVCDDCRTDLEE